MHLAENQADEEQSENGVTHYSEHLLATSRRYFEINHPYHPRPPFIHEEEPS